jgi:1-acyl-sn-glycerol-3-phosphate acyltransferase
MKPGVITVVIGEPISPAGKSPEQMARAVEEWIEGQMRRIAPHRYAQGRANAPPAAAAPMGGE